MRITTRYDQHDFAGALFGCLHEFGHGLYEAGIPDRLGARRSASRSRSACTSRRAGCGRTSSAAAARSAPGCSRGCAEHLPGALAARRRTTLYRAINRVQRSLIRVEADETTYNLHIVLRFELELGLIEGTLRGRRPAARLERGRPATARPRRARRREGVLQDVHWGGGLIGYFPTYTLGNLIAAQLWEAVREELPDIDGQLERGEFAPLRGWLRENIHVHGRKFPPPELLRG